MSNKKLDKQKAIFWLETEGRFYTQDDCALRLGVTKQRINQIIAEHKIPRPIPNYPAAMAEVRRLQSMMKG